MFTPTITGSHLKGHGVKLVRAGVGFIYIPLTPLCNPSADKVLCPKIMHCITHEATDNVLLSIFMAVMIKCIYAFLEATYKTKRKC